jgi:hypothetical protein
VQFLPQSDSKKTGKKFPEYYFQPTWEIAFQHSKIEEQVQHAPLPQPSLRFHKTSNLSSTQTSNTQRSQQHKTNMERRRSLQRTAFQAEIQKNSEKQPFTHSDSKQKQQRNS